MKILLIQLRRIGDILLSTPSVSYLKSVLPNSQVDFLCESMGKTIFENNPHINDCRIYNRSRGLAEIREIRKASYDCIIDFMGNPRSAILTALSGAQWRVGFNHRGRGCFYNLAKDLPMKREYNSKRKIDLVRHWLEKTQQESPQPKSIRPQMYISAKETKFAVHWMEKEEQSPKSFVIMVPAHRHGIRQWRPEGFRNVALNLLNKRNIKTYLAWGPGEENLMAHIRRGNEDKIGLLPPTNIREMASIIQQARCVVTNDSGAMHVAVAVETPTATIYGPTDPSDWNPALTDNRSKATDKVLQAKEVACLGCHRGECPFGHLCMTLMKEQSVLQSVESLLN